MRIEIVINRGKPNNKSQWDDLCYQNGNLNQATIFDSLQIYFKQEPIYFEVLNEKSLIGGVKLYEWCSKKLGNITKVISYSISQLGEIILSSTLDDETINNVLSALKIKVQEYILSNNYTNYTTGGVYGNEDLLIALDKNHDSESFFNASYVDISKTEADILKGFNRNTKRNLAKADESNLEFIEIKDVDLFNSILKEVYGQQYPPQKPPTAGYVKKIAEVLLSTDKLDMHVVKHNGKVLSASYFSKLGDTAYSWFGGSIKNDVGAGQFLYWELMKKYKTEGITKFYFGQVAIEGSEENKKFQGISNFKRGFGLVELKSFKKIYILKPIKHRLWKTLMRLRS
jgi:hypothetical protein